MESLAKCCNFQGNDPTAHVECPDLIHEFHVIGDKAA